MRRKMLDIMELPELKLDEVDDRDAWLGVEKLVDVSKTHTERWEVLFSPNYASTVVGNLWRVKTADYYGYGG